MNKLIITAMNPTERVSSVELNLAGDSKAVVKKRLSVFRKEIVHYLLTSYQYSRPDVAIDKLDYLLENLDNLDKDEWVSAEIGNLSFVWQTC